MVAELLLSHLGEQVDCGGDGGHGEGQRGREHHPAQQSSSDWNKSFPIHFDFVESDKNYVIILFEFADFSAYADFPYLD